MQTLAETAESRSMDEYRNFVRQIADKESDEVILNRCKEHASIIIAALFRKAKSAARIVTCRLSEEVYGSNEVINSVTSALKLNPDLMIEVLSEEAVDPKHPLLRAIDEAQCSSRISIQTMAPKLTHKVDVHFAVVDQKYYRLENDKKQRAAVVQFGNEVLGKQLDAYFCKLVEINDLLN